MDRFTLEDYGKKLEIAEAGIGSFKKLNCFFSMIFFRFSSNFCSF